MTNNTIHFISGAIAGICEVCVTMPIDVAKTNMQIYPKKYTNPIQTISTIYKTTGFKSLYRGFFPYLLQNSGKIALRFSLFNITKQSLVDNKLINEGTKLNFFAGIIAGITEATIWTTPTEKIKVLQQTTGLKKITFPSLFEGGLPTALRQSSSVAFRFTMYPKVKQLLGSDSNLINFLAGGIVGGFSVIMNHPVDVIKSKRQSGNAESYIKSIKNIYNTSGIRGFYSGLSARVPCIFLGQAITFSVYEKMYKLLSKV